MRKSVFIFLFCMSVIMNASCTTKEKAMKSIEGKDGVFAIMETTQGTIALELYYKDAPLTVLNFTGLAEGTLDAAKGSRFYDGLKFHRVIKDFMIQGGDPRGNGTGGPGYSFADEIVEKYTFDGPGVLAMANSGANTNGSQFFITHVETPWLNGKHTIFGRVVSGQDVIDKIKQGDEIKHIEIIRSGSDAEGFAATQDKFDELSENAARLARAAKDAKLAEKIAEVEKAFPNFTKTADGIYYKITKDGSGEKTGKGKAVAVEYKGYLVDGTVFDQSAGRGALEFQTAAGQMIPGFDMMVQDMQKGEKRTIVIPPDLAYGERGYPGVIPENSYIAFDIELVKN